MSDKQQHPSLVGGHAQYIKGVAEGLVGNATGAEDWKASADKDKEAAIETMKAASANRNPETSGFGKIEQQAGSLVGCEGMEKEGQQSKQS